jgi:tetratricopeptide (TPR) repeat protein
MAAFSSDKDAQKVFDQGNVLLNQGNYDEALTAFEQFLAKYPEIYQVHLNIGTCYLKKGDLDKAEEEFKLVLDKVMAAQGDYKKDAASSVRALSGLGEIAVRKGDFETAKKNFSQALDVSPQDQVAAYNVGEIFFSNQQIDDAIKYLELATQIKKDWSKPYLRLGYVYLNKGDFTKSLESFNKFIELDPSSPDVPQVKNIIETIEKMKK